MNISYNWLKRFFEVEQSPRDLAAILTSLGLECDTIEEIESIRGGLRGVVVGKVLTCVPHPDSDHLHITTCDLGTGEPVQIVCGAPNVAAGQTVVVATVGCSLWDGDREVKIKKSKIRGVESFGMICAEDEIGVGSSHDGIMVLPADVRPGTPAAEYFRLESDWRLEVELTPNRVDAASHYGVARDLRAWTTCRNYGAGGREMPQVTLPEAESFRPSTLEGAAQIRVLDTEGCPRYCGVTLRGVTVKESPEWLRRLLEAAGQRPINNVVDVTNFVLLGIGQPLHSFDLDKVEGETIVVRTCPEGTPFVTLDGVERKLSEADMMICDARKPLCIAGVFGGLDSGVTESTRNVFIESACFNPTRVRRTARRHGLSTDASFRYERGTDPEILPYAARLAAVMIRQLGGGEICGEVLDSAPQGFPPFHVELSMDYCDRLIGKKLDRGLVRAILRSLDIEVLPESTDGLLLLQVPRYRVDVTRPCDVVEEILRVYGYNNVEFGMEMHATPGQKQTPDFSWQLQEIASGWLSGLGFSEILNNSLSSTAYYSDNAEYRYDECIELLNPLSRDLAVMRRTLLYGGLETIARNVNRKATDLRLYEFGKVYWKNPGRESTEEKPLAPYSEQMRLALWMTGNLSETSWNRPALESSFFDLKAVVWRLLQRLGIHEGALKSVQGSDSLFTAMLTLTNHGGKWLGTIGIPRRKTLHSLDIEAPVYYAELDWEGLVKLAGADKVEFTPLPRTMPVRRDLALLLDGATQMADVERVIGKAERKLVKGVRLFDVYEGGNVPQGKKSYAVAITLQDPERTLNDRQIDAVMTRITAALRKELGAELR